MTPEPKKPDNPETPKPAGPMLSPQRLMDAWTGVEDKRFALARAIQSDRLERGLTQQDIAARLGVTQQAVGNWEAGRSRPQARVLAELVGLFGEGSLTAMRAADGELTKRSPARAKRMLAEPEAEAVRDDESLASRAPTHAHAPRAISGLDRDALLRDMSELSRELAQMVRTVTRAIERISSS